MQYLGAVFVSLWVASMAFAESAVRDDGRQVRLNGDGSWELISTDVFATSESGLRVVLKQDGTWQALDTQPEASSNAVNSNVTMANSYFSVTDIFIEKVAVERGGSNKNDVFNYQTVVTLNTHKPLAVQILKDTFFTVSDNKGNDYRVKTAQLVDATTIRLLLKGAPKRFSRIKSFNITIAQEVAATLADVQLAYDYRDVETRLRHEFSK